MIWIGALERVQNFPSPARCAAIAGVAAATIVVLGSQIQTQAAHPVFTLGSSLCFACGAHGFRTAAQYLQEHGMRRYEEHRHERNHPLAAALNNTVGGLFFGAWAMWGAFNIQF